MTANKLDSGFYILRHKLLITILGLIFIFLLIQFVRLATVGRLGTKISSVEEKIKNVEIENEMLRSEISALKSTSTINNQEILSERLNPVDLYVIQPKLTSKTIVAIEDEK